MPSLTKYPSREVISDNESLVIDAHMSYIVLLGNDLAKSARNYDLHSTPYHEVPISLKGYHYTIRGPING